MKMKFWQVDVGEQRHWIAAEFEEEAIGIAIGWELQGGSPLSEIVKDGVDAKEMKPQDVAGMHYVDEGGGKIALWAAFELASGARGVIASHDY